VLVFESLADAHRSLLRSGTRFEVLDPPELRARVAETARELVAMYGR
jgi:WYL domain